MIASKQFKTLWLIEDDSLYSQVLRIGLTASLKGVQIKRFATESQALEQIAKVEEGEVPPDLVIADVMIPYVFPGEGEVSPEIAALGENAFREAGLRLWKKARNSKSSALRSVPWFFLSVLRSHSMKFEEHFDQNTKYVGKDLDFKALFESIRTNPDSLK
jgi:CheY-like chemotaxis protein